MNAVTQFVVCLGMLWSATALSADDLASRTLILVNAGQPESVELGEFYARARNIPRENLIALPMPATESITWREFVDYIWQPLQNELLGRKWLDGFASSRVDAHGRRRTSITGHRIAYLVACRGTPLRIHHDPTDPDATAAQRVPEQFRTNQAAVDSELSLLPGGDHSLIGYRRNPLFESNRPTELIAGQVLKVARLDGPTLDDAKKLVASAIEGERRGPRGRFYIDRGGPHADGDAWLDATRSHLTKLGFDGDVHEGPGTFQPTDRFDEPVFYFGWYTAVINGPFLREQFQFPCGAIALHIHSHSAETLRSPTEQWTGPLVARGVAATFGNVFEPYLQLTIRPDLLVKKLGEGATLGDAAYYATPALSWQGIIVGDPLYRPFRKP